jgi:hypothetical protein
VRGVCGADEEELEELEDVGDDWTEDEEELEEESERCINTGGLDWYESALAHLPTYPHRKGRRDEEQL